jgi:hypothetical protein
MNLWLGAFVAAALLLAAIAVRSRSRGGIISCPLCGGPARLQEPYVMGDSCQRCVGLNLKLTTIIEC